MEIIEKLPENEYDSICDAGVELVRELQQVMRRHGLEKCHAFNVLIVAAAGVAAASEMTSEDLAGGVDAVIHMWKVKDEGGERTAVFDPTSVDRAYAESDQLSAN